MIYIINGKMNGKPVELVVMQPKPPHIFWIWIYRIFISLIAVGMVVLMWVVR